MNTVVFKRNFNRFMTVLFVSFLICNCITLCVLKPLPVKADVATGTLGALSLGITSSEGGAATSFCLLNPEIAIPLSTCLIAGGLVFQNRNQIARVATSAFNYLKGVGCDIGKGFVKTASGAYQVTGDCKAKLLNYISGLKAGTQIIPGVVLVSNLTIPAGKTVYTNISVPYLYNTCYRFRLFFTGTKTQSSGLWYVYKTDGYNGEISGDSPFTYDNFYISYDYPTRADFSGKRLDLPSFKNSYIGLQNTATCDFNIGITLTDSIPASVFNGSTGTYADTNIASTNSTVCVPSGAVSWEDFVGTNATNLKDKVATQDVATGATTGTWPKDTDTTPDNPSAKDYTSHLTGIKGLLQNIWDFIKNLPELIFNAFKAILQGILDVLNAIKESICALPRVLNDGWDRVIGAVGAVAGAVGNVLEVPLDGIRSAVDGVGAKVGSIADGVKGFFDLSKPINLDKMKMSGELLENKFPFSLPWDIKNGFMLMVEPQKSPNVTVDCTNTVLAQKFVLSLDDFNIIFQIIRTMEFLLFNIALVKITPRLLGGDS